MLSTYGFPFVEFPERVNILHLFVPGDLVFWAIHRRKCFLEINSYVTNSIGYILLRNYQ